MYIYGCIYKVHSSCTHSLTYVNIILTVKYILFIFKDNDA